MSEKDKAVQSVAESIVSAIRKRRPAVAYVRCEGVTTCEDAEATLIGFKSHINWRLVNLEGKTPLAAFADAGTDPRLVFLVRSCTETALEMLNAHRESYDRRQIRAVFILTTAQIRTFARLCPEYWNQRDCFVSWPSQEPNEDEHIESDYREGVVKGINRRLENASRMPPGYERGKAMFIACRDAFFTGEVDLASQHMVGAISEIREVGQSDELGEAFQILGACAEQRGDLRSANDWYAESLRYWQESGSPEGLATIYTSLGQLFYRMDEIPNASEYLGQAVELEESINNPTRLCDVYRFMAMIREREDSLTDSQRLLEKSERYAKDIGDDIRLGRSIHHQARVQERLERWAEARDLYNRALTLRERHRDMPGMAATLHQLGNVYFNRAEHDQSIDSYERAITIEKQLNDENGLAASLMQLAHVSEERFQHDLAYKSLLQARPLLKKLHSPLTTEVEKRLVRISKLMTRKEMKRIEEEVNTAGDLMDDDGGTSESSSRDLGLESTFDADLEAALGEDRTDGA